MKTVTEFSGSTLKGAAAVKTKLAGEGVAPEQMAERLGAELSISGDRLARLMEALEAAGEQVERVRLMRVFAATDEPKGAKKIGEFNYLIDLQPSAAPQGRDRGRSGGRDRGRGGGGGGGGGGPGGAGGARGGAGGKGFAMGRDGLPKEDRGPLQSAGAGWTLTRDPSAPAHDKRRGKPGGPKRGKPGDRRGPGGPGGERRGPGGPPRGPGAPGADARGPRGPRRDRPAVNYGPRPGAPGAPGAPGSGAPGAPGQAAEAGGPNAPGAPGGEARRHRRRGRGRGGPFALQPSTAPGAAAALGIPTAATTGIDPNAPQSPPGPPGLPGQKKRRRRGGRGRGGGQGPRPPQGMAGAPLSGAPTTGIPGEQAQEEPRITPQHLPPSEPNGNIRPPEAAPPMGADEAAPEPGNER